MHSGKKGSKGRGIELPSGEDMPVDMGKSWFFGIGINHYRHKEIPNLNNAVGDVKAVLSLLEEKYELDEAITLFDIKATRSNILREFEKLAVKVGVKDKLLIFFSGHGILDKWGKGYWIPFDGEKSYFSDHVPNLLIKNQIENIDSRHTLLITDACFSGTMLYSKRKKKVVTLVKELERYRSRLVVTSGRHFQLADDGEPGEHSPFAASIIEYLEENQAYELNFTKFCEEIRSRTNERAAKQSPVFGRLNLDDDEGGEYIFRLKQNEAQIWMETIKAGTVLALSRFLSDFPSGQFSDEARKMLPIWEEEDAYWNNILKKEKISAFHSYLGKYPGGRYAFEAIRWIRVLEEQIKQTFKHKKQELPAATQPKKQKPREKPSESQPKSQLLPSAFTDPRDGQTYRIMDFNGQRWMAQDLNYDVGEGCWFYGDDPRNSEKYGRLYTWEAAKNACPPGWRLPTDEEWGRVKDKFGGDEEAFGALIKGGSTIFSASLGGYRNIDGKFRRLGYHGYYWSATENGTNYVWCSSFVFYSNYGKFRRSIASKSFGYSCRCVQATLTNDMD